MRPDLLRSTARRFLRETDPAMHRIEDHQPFSFLHAGILALRFDKMAAAHTGN